MEGATYCSKCKKRTPDAKTKLERKKRCFYLKSACSVCCGGKSKRVPKDRVKAIKESSSEKEDSMPSATEVKQISPEVFKALSEIYPSHFTVNDEFRDVMLGECVDSKDSPEQE